MIRTEMMARMSAEELYEWLAYYTIVSEDANKPAEQTPADMLAILEG